MSIFHIRNKANLSRLFVAVIFFAVFLLYMSRLHPEVAFMDSLRYLTYVGNSFDRESSIFTTWSQGEHRGYLVQFGTYVNAKLFDFSVIGAAYLCGVVILLTGWALVGQQLRLSQTYAVSKANIMLLMVLTFFTLFSLANWELYSLDVGVYIYLKNFIFVLFWIYLFRVLSQESTSRSQTIYLLLSIPVIILTISYGWGYAFVIATIFIVCIVPLGNSAKKIRAMVILTMLLSLIIYAVGGTIAPTDMGKAPLQNANITNSIIGVFFAISSIFMGQESSVALGIGNHVRVTFSAVFISFLSYLLFINLKRRKELVIPFALIVYSCLHILAVSYARGRVDPVQAMAPRYFLDFSLLAIGFFWIFVFSDIKYRYIKAVGYFFVVTFVIGQLFTCLDEYRKAPHRHDSFLKMKVSTLAGSITLDEARRLQQPLDRAEKGIAVQRRFGLGPYREITCDSPYFIEGHFPDKWVGAESRFLLRNCYSEVAIALYLPPHFPGTSVTASDPTGLVVGEVSIESGTTQILRVNTKYMPLILDLKLSVATTHKPSELQTGVSDTRNLGVLITSLANQ